MMALRPYQQDLVAKVCEHRRPLIVLPTGAGKTIVASEIIRRAENKHILFLAHRRELIYQARDQLSEFDIAAGVILAGHPMSATRGVQVASVQTLWSRCFRQDKELPPADVVFVDEAHHCPARTYRQILEAYPGAQIIGMTATPSRRDGRGLGNIFDALVEGPQVADLIEQGFLVGTKVYAPTKPDLKGVHTRHGDYVESELAERMDRAELVGDIVSHWLRLNPARRKTVCFTTSVAHSIHLNEEFCKVGVKAEHIDGSTPKDERDEILARLSEGELELVTNCMVLTEGWDQPDVSCCILARPTKSTGLFRQMVGRVLRPHDGKDHALILDHAGAVFSHGFVEDPMTWPLAPDKKAENTAHAARDLKPSSRLLECSQCHAIRTAGQACPHCGFRPRRPAEYIQVGRGELTEIDRKGNQRPQVYTREYKQAFYLGLLWLARFNGHKLGAAAHRYKEKFREWPPFEWKAMRPIEPGPEVIAWDRHCRIRFAKAIQKTAVHG